MMLCFRQLIDQNEDNLPVAMVATVFAVVLPFRTFVVDKALRELVDVALVAFRYLLVVEVSPGRGLFGIAFECFRQTLGQFQRAGEHRDVAGSDGRITGGGGRVEDGCLGLFLSLFYGHSDFGQLNFILFNALGDQLGVLDVRRNTRLFAVYSIDHTFPQAA